MAKKLLTINKTFLIFILLVSPITLMALFSYVRLTRELSDLILSRRETLAHLSAEHLEQKFDYLIDIGTVITDRKDFRELLKAGRWQEAILLLKETPDRLPVINSIALIAPDGTLKATTPYVPDVVGVNFAFRDWYQGVTATQAPYLSEVFKAANQVYGIVLAIPIKSDSGQLIGILLKQVKLDTFLEWSKELDVGDSGFMYFVDQRGHVVAHPLTNPQGGILDFSDVPAVVNVLKGQHGVEVSASPFDSDENLLSAYRPVDKYNWGVLIAQPAEIAFMSRDNTLTGLFIVFLVLFVLDCLLAYVLIKVTNIIQV